MNRCIFVFGPESSGIRLMTKVLIDAGCYGTDSMFQNLDDEMPERNVPPQAKIVAWHRSFPYGAQGQGRHWPSIAMLRNQAFDAGFEDQVAIVMMRDFYCSTKSKVKAGHERDVADSQKTTRTALRRIFIGLDSSRLDFVPVTYEGLVMRPNETLGWLLPLVGLEPIRVNYVRDENAKWYR